jgi:3-methyladenine DNA glycosylase Tag
MAKNLDEDEIFSQICWVIYSSGFRYQIVGRYWPAITEAFYDFDVDRVQKLSDNLEVSAYQICKQSGFKNLNKAKWCIRDAKRITELRNSNLYVDGIKGILVELSTKVPSELVECAPSLVSQLGFVGIGKTTIFHLLKNLGIDIFKPDIHVRRLLTSLGLSRPEANVKEICDAMLVLSSLMKMRLNEVDTLLFFYGQAVGDSANL